jgi:hypothetical protein
MEQTADRGEERAAGIVERRGSLAGREDGDVAARARGRDDVGRAFLRVREGHGVGERLRADRRAVHDLAGRRDPQAVESVAQSPESDGALTTTRPAATTGDTPCARVASATRSPGATSSFAGLRKVQPTTESTRTIAPPPDAGIAATWSWTMLVFGGSV